MRHERVGAGLEERSRRPSATGLLGAILVLPLAAACGTGDDDPAGDAGSSPPTTSQLSTAPPSTSPTASPKTSASVSPSSSAPAGPSDGPPAFAAGTTPQSTDYPTDADLVFVGSRAGEHGAFDRIVVEFEGTGAPGWSVRYVEHPRFEGSGDPVPVAGDEVLQIGVSGITFHNPTGDYVGPRHFQPARGGEVVDMIAVGAFEGYASVFAGISGGRRPFRVFTLSGPPRLVVDVRRAQG